MGNNFQGNRKDGKGNNQNKKELVMKPEDYPKILTMKTNKENLVSLIDSINNFVKGNFESITSNQLRNIYDEISKAKTLIDIQLIRPKLAYNAGRKAETKEVMAFLDGLLKIAGLEIQNKPDKENEIIQNIIEYFAALVSYHKFHFGEKQISM